MFTRRVLPLLLALVVVSTLSGPAAPARAQEDPLHVPWTELLPPAPAGYEGSASHLCPQGQTRCVDIVVREMTRRADRLARRCDHDAVFAFTYLRTTEEYRRAIDDPAFFDDTPFVNHQDVVFADYYFRAYDAWHAGRDVPAAWAEAFQAADGRRVTGTGNMLLGINAHVNHDLPFVLAEIGIVQPDGDSRKPDHDQVNVFLNRVTERLIPELAARFDESIDDGSVPHTSLDATATFQLMAAWREQAWRNAERLVNAASPTARERVAAEIEDAAGTTGALLATQYSYVPPLTGPAGRDAFCNAQRGGS